MKPKLRKFSFKPGVALAIASMSGVILFWIILLIVQWLQPGYNPIRQSLSDLALGHYGWLMRADFFLLAIVAIGLGAGIYYNFGKKRNLLKVVFLFGVVGLGEIINGSFQADLVKTTMSIHALIHQAGASISAIAFVAAAFLLLPHLRADSRWKGLATYTFAVAVFMLVLIITREVLLLTAWLDPWFGLYERVLMVNILVWVEVMAIRMYLRSRPG